VEPLTCVSRSRPVRAAYLQQPPTAIRAAFDGTCSAEEPRPTPHTELIGPLYSKLGDGALWRVGSH
jgi:hypothetical protein